MSPQPIPPHEAERLYRQAEELFGQQEYEKSLRVLRYVDERRPNSKDVAKGILACCQQLGLVAEEAEARARLQMLTGEGGAEPAVAFTSVDDLLGPPTSSKSAPSKDRSRKPGHDRSRVVPIVVAVLLLGAAACAALVWFTRMNA